jgi:osmotically-inducible protein OsmY
MTDQDRLHTLVSSALEQSPHFRGRRLKLETHEGRVRLHGVVPSWYQKQMAQETLRGVTELAAIENHLVVEWT